MDANTQSSDGQPEKSLPINVSNFNLYTCHSCKKILVNSMVVNDNRAGVATPEGEETADYCWDCFAALPGFSFVETAGLVKCESQSTDGVGGTDGEDAVAMQEEVGEVVRGDENTDESATPESSVKRVKMDPDGDEDNIMNFETFGSLGSNHGNAGDVSGAGVVESVTEHQSSSLTTETDDDNCTLCAAENKGQIATEGTAEEDTSSSPGVETKTATVDIALNLVVTDSHTLEETKFELSRTQTDYYCEKCDKYFMTDYSVKRHERRVHRADKLICSLCSRKFNWPASLKEHERIHTGDRPYRCHTCGKGFVSQMKMTRHALIHSDVKPFLCVTCGKRFNQKSTLKAHERTHSGVKPYPCGMCGKKFVQKSNKALHEKKCHLPFNAM